MNYNIAQSLTEIAGKLGDSIGLVEASSCKKMSFAELDARADSFAHILLHGGVQRGEKIILMVKPSADFICLTFALFKIGAPVILIDPGMGYKNLLRCIEGIAPQGFVGIPKAHLFRSLFRKHFKTVKHRFCCGASCGVFGSDISQGANKNHGFFPVFEAAQDDLAAIIFTTGSTGPPKGVRYEHSVFNAQLELIRDYYGIGPGDIDQPAFPLFALFSTALGAQAVIPEMDPTCPAKVDPALYVASIEKYKVSYSFASPALWKVIGKYGRDRDKRLSTLRKILMAGAPVSGALIARMQKVLPENAKIHTPYGATESLPIVSIEGKEVVEETWGQTQRGYGTCVGRSLPGISIAVIPIRDTVISNLNGIEFLPTGEIGEIIVQGAVVTKEYDNNVTETALAKIQDGSNFWHRMGDVGYLDNSGRLWFCGRRVHRVVSAVFNKTFFPIPCEALFNVHPQVFRSALVGVQLSNGKGVIPVIIVEPEKGVLNPSTQLIDELKEIAKSNILTKEIQHYLIHSDFPVDIRHNAKIFREKLQIWAEKELDGAV